MSAMTDVVALKFHISLTATTGIARRGTLRCRHRLPLGGGAAAQ
jgi:hypothetical protein